MSTETLTLDEIRHAGLEVLGHHLGPMGMVRFLQQYETGRGHYNPASRNQHPPSCIKYPAPSIRDQATCSAASLSTLSFQS